MEDSGYMARAAFVIDRLMIGIGLPGSAFVPLIVGFGCNVPAVMATRALSRENDRLNDHCDGAFYVLWRAIDGLRPLCRGFLQRPRSKYCVLAVFDWDPHGDLYGLGLQKTDFPRPNVSVLC